MRFSLAFSALVSVVPALANAIPRRTGMVIPLARHATQVADDQGVVNREMLKTLAAKTSRKLNRGFQAYEKNTGKAHPSAMKQSGDLHERDSGSGFAPLVDANDILWYGPISIGTPPVNYTVMFDTGSSDIVVPGTECGVSCQGRKAYNTTASSTAKDLGQSFKINYIGGSSVEGEVFSDTVTLAGLTASNQAVGAASEYSPTFLTNLQPPDGIIGMALTEISEFGQEGFFENLVAQGGTTVPQFSFKLAASGSELFLGGANPAMYTGEFTNLNVTTKGWWQLSLDSVNANAIAAVSKKQAIIDNGSPLIAAPEQEVIEFYKAIPFSRDASDTVGPGMFTFPCLLAPQVSLTFGRKRFVVHSFNIGHVSPGSFECVGGIMALKDIDLWVIGEVFLRDYYTRFDTETVQVGFADLAR